MAGDREKALEAGCDDYDTKPVELPRLLGKIEALLREEAYERTRPAGRAQLRHELRTPFNAIIGYAEMLLEEGGRRRTGGTGVGPGVTAQRGGQGTARASAQRIPGGGRRGGTGQTELRPNWAGGSRASLPPLSLTLTELIQKAHGDKMQEALPDLERIRGAAWGLAQLAQERLLDQRREAAVIDRPTPWKRRPRACLTTNSRRRRDSRRR